MSSTQLSGKKNISGLLILILVIGIAILLRDFILPTVLWWRL